MSKLTTKERKELPKGEFAGPGRSYPVNDRAHAANAKARASEMEHKGKISKGTEAMIDRKADKKLGKPRGVGMAHSNVRNQASHADKMRHC